MKRIVINTREILYFIIIFPFVRIESLTIFPLVDTLYDVLRVLSFLLVLGLCFGMLRSRTVKNDKFIRTSFLYVFLAFISTMVHHTDFVTTVARYLPVITLSLLISYISMCKDSLYFFRACSKYFSLLIWANFIGLLIKPNGLYTTENLRVGMLYDTGVKAYVLGKANALTPIIISMLVVILIRDYQENNKITSYGITCIAVSIVSILLMKSGTGIIGIFVYIVLFVFHYIRKSYSSKSMNFRLILLISVLLTVGVVLFNIQKYFSLIISGVLHKDITLTNRTNVWKMMLNYISSQFKALDYLIGSGLINYRQEVFNGRYAHCHNQFFDQFIQTGFLGLFLYLKLFYLSLGRIMKRYNMTNNAYLILIASAIISFVIMFIAEVYTTPLVFLILAMGFYNSELIKNTKERNYGLYQ